MKRHAAYLLACFLLVAYILIACQPEEITVPELVEVTRLVSEEVITEGEVVEVTRIVQEQIVVTPASASAAEVAQLPADQPAATGQTRLIIKDGRMTVIVRDTEAAVNAATGFTVDYGGYIISQQVYDDAQGYRYAELRLAVPVDQFENAMRSLRGLGEVTNESASGEDVTDQFVDLNSRLANLGATRDRLRTFLDQAEDVDQALQVNEELKRIEEEIAVIQGRINFLRDRSAFSTIDLTLTPWIPTPTPTPTATATPSPTPTPLPTAEVWLPGDTAQLAAVELQETAQDTADFAIYYGIVCGPWLLLLLALALPAWFLSRRRLWAAIRKNES